MKTAIYIEEKKGATMKKYTEGPWKAETYADGGFDITSDRLRVICARNGAPRPEESRSNARLIASAPEMLEALEGAASALKKALPFLPADNEAIYCGEWLSEITEIIRKAKGE